MVAPARSARAGFALAFVERGRGVAAAVGRERPVVAGEMCLSPGRLRLRGAALYGWLLTIDADWIAAVTSSWLAGTPGPSVRLLAPQERSRCAVFFRALEDELGRGESDRAVLRALLELIVAGYSRASPAPPVRAPHRGDEPAEAATPTSAHRLAAEVLDVIDARFAERLSLVDVAAELARSPASVHARRARSRAGRCSS